MVNGILNIDKPAGITSHDVVDRVRRISGERRVGHAGTLDPFATGVLIIAIGSATRLLEYTRDLPKTYRATFMLGATSDTDDKTGRIVSTKFEAQSASWRTKQISKNQILNALKIFKGTIEQVPPAYSAIKVKGKKLYELARAGKPVIAKARKVTIYDIKLLTYEYPAVELEITCGSGTYIRSIARDLGEKLGIGAYVETLRRTAIGNFVVSDLSLPDSIGQSRNSAVELNKLTSENIGQYILPPLTLARHLPQIVLTQSQAKDFQQGKSITSVMPIRQLAEIRHPDENPVFAVFDTSNKELIGIGQIQNSILKPQKVLMD